VCPKNAVRTEASKGGFLLAIRNRTTRNGWAGLNAALVVAFLGFAPACGNDDGLTADTGDLVGAPEEEVQEASADQPLDDSVDSPEPAGTQSSGPGTASGIYVVDGESRNAMMARCEEDSGTAVRLLEAPAADHDGQLEISISSEELADPTNTDEYVTYEMQLFNISVASFTTGVFAQTATTDPDGNWYSGYFTATIDEGARLPGPPYALDGDHLTGELTLDQTHPEEESGTMDVAIDLVVPSEESGLC
jgi:hypothetical protein